MSEISSLSPPSFMRRTAGYGVFAIGVIFAFYMATKAWEANKVYKAWLHEQEQTLVKGRKAKVEAKDHKKKVQQAAAKVDDKEIAQVTPKISPQEQLLTSASFIGTWVGKYNNNHLVLSIGDKFEAVFIFSLLGHPDMRNGGCFKMKIEFDGKNELITFQPTKWVVQPSSYMPVALRGSFNSTQQNIQGDVLFGNPEAVLSRFNLARPSTPVALPKGCKLLTGG